MIVISFTFLATTNSLMASKYKQSLLQHFKINYMQDGTLDITVHIYWPRWTTWGIL